MHEDSAAIADIAYDAARGKLIVSFRGGERRLYVGVPPTVHRALEASESQAQFFGREIAERYPYNQLGA